MKPIPKVGFINDETLVYHKTCGKNFVLPPY